MTYRFTPLVLVLTLFGCGKPAKPTDAPAPPPEPEAKLTPAEANKQITALFDTLKQTNTELEKEYQRATTLGDGAEKLVAAHRSKALAEQSRDNWRKMGKLLIAAHPAGPVPREMWSGVENGIDIAERQIAIMDKEIQRLEGKR